MGDIVNATALGRSGILIAYDENEKKPKIFRAALRIRQYFQFLRNVQKPTFSVDNLLILSNQQMKDIFKNSLCLQGNDG